MREAVKAAKRFVSAPVFQDYVLEALGPLATAETDEEIEAYVRGYSGTTAHPVGTASMSPRGAQWGVVDPDLKMKGGVQGVRIVDASVFVSAECATNISVLTRRDSLTTPACIRWLQHMSLQNAGPI